MKKIQLISIWWNASINLKQLFGNFKNIICVSVIYFEKKVLKNNYGHNSSPFCNMYDTESVKKAVKSFSVCMTNMHECNKKDNYFNWLI